MAHEFEAKFLNVDPAQVREMFKNAGYVLVRPEFLMRRKTYLFPDNDQQKWGRVRDEGDRITLAIKHIVDASRIDGTLEHEVVVSDFDEAGEVLKMAGLVENAYQENAREIWIKGDIEATIDTWPGLLPYIEIEGKSEQDVRDAVAQLGLDFDQAVFGGAGDVYRRILDINISDFPVVTFEKPPTV